jgi:FkbM family methyltransferase
MELFIMYGVVGNYKDVTEIAYNKCVKDNILFIPKSEAARAKLFTDPVYGSLKCIFIQDENGIITIYDHTKNVYADIRYNKIYVDVIPDYILEIYPDFEKKLQNIHNELKIEYGSFKDEYPEQLMVAKYLTGNEKVLEIGGNIGRNSLIIGHLLKNNNNNNFVTLECDTYISEQLTNNRDLNNMYFHVENSALSKRKLIQKGWDTITSDVLLDGYKPVNIIAWEELKNKYHIEFDTLVLDCEGAFYYILMDMPEILTNIKLIIMENDYYEISKKEYVDDILYNNNFYVDYQEAGGFGPCYNRFYEVWKRLI